MFLGDVQDGVVGGAAVAFVEDEEVGDAVGADLLDGAEADGDVVFDAGVGGVDDDEEEVGLHGDVEGGLEGGDEAVGEVADEADGVGEEDLAGRGEPDLARFGVEGGEEAVVHVGVGVGEDVEEGGLAGVGVADHGDDGPLAFGLVARGLAFLDVGEAFLEFGDAAAEGGVAELEVTFAGAFHADAAFEALLGLGELDARELELELGEFDLCLGLGGAGAAGEDLEDDLGAVHNADVDGLGEVVGLDGAEFVVEDDGVGVLLGDERAEVFDLT